MSFGTSQLRVYAYIDHDDRQNRCQWHSIDDWIF